jgi:anti-sigma-K factor RskA
MADDLHELSALYALDVLSGEERTRFEEHLDECDRCRAELAGLRDAASSLAFAVEGPAPPPELRERIIEAVGAERQNVVPFRPRRSFAVSVAAATAVAASAAAVALGIWAASLHKSLAHERATISVITDPRARRVPLHGAPGQLVVAPSGDAVLSVELPKLPKGKTYEAWVADPSVQPAGVFSGGTTKLRVRVHRGAQVLVSVERAGGSNAPTTTPIVSARA